MTGSDKNFYKPLILLLLFAFLIFSGWSAWQASSRGSEVTDRDYYSKGLKYNSTIVEKRAAEVLGWTLSSEINDQTLRFSLNDKDNQAVSGARGIIYLFPPKNPKGLQYHLSESSPGTYTFPVPQEYQGTLRARLTFERNGAKLNRQLQLNL
ncbi:MAG: hypothetical protein C0619_00035 [Desulfuromonas sp.]|nr:MAG: hypothetical protein C0619_00035 [Desulfuromonas sp.]